MFSFLFSLYWTCFYKYTRYTVESSQCFVSILGTQWNLVNVQVHQCCTSFSNTCTLSWCFACSWWTVIDAFYIYTRLISTVLKFRMFFQIFHGCNGSHGSQTYVCEPPICAKYVPLILITTVRISARSLNSTVAMLTMSSHCWGVDHIKPLLRCWQCEATAEVLTMSSHCWDGKR